MKVLNSNIYDTTIKFSRRDIYNFDANLMEC